MADKSAPAAAESQRQGSLIPRLRVSRPTMSRVDQAVTDYVLGNPEEVIPAAVADLATRCGVSVGSVVGFCQRLGFKGFSDFKIALAREVAESGLPTDRRSTSDLENVVEFHRLALAETMTLNPAETVDAAVDAILDAGRIELYAVGVAHPVAAIAAAGLTLIGFRANAAPDAHMQLVTASQLGPKDVAIGISPTGRVPETIRSLEVAKSQGATTVCITNSLGSPVANTSDIQLLATPADMDTFTTPLPSLVTHMALVDTIFVSLIRKARPQTAAYQQRANEYIQQWL